ncbi:hypothetical protein [Blastococcus sp. TF02-8]|uniref:hypothetical protein n=1 Tax=Blastococcus sp. TF02-8 TaxID=2250574 RepID=UPI00197AB785|nr:hypothetical protein [Blastococcus sp. TF02-8]
MRRTRPLSYGRFSAPIFHGALHPQRGSASRDQTCARYRDRKRPTHSEVAWPRLVVDGDRAVGFLMAFLDIDWLGDGSRSDVRSGLWRLNIAAEEQGRG